MATKKKGKAAARKSPARPARKAATRKAATPKAAKKTAARKQQKTGGRKTESGRGGDRSGIVYSDPRREALARRLIRT